MTVGQMLMFLVLLAALSVTGIGMLLYMAGMAMRDRSQDNRANLGETAARQVNVKQAR